MEDKLVTLAIHTFEKAQILKTIALKHHHIIIKKRMEKTNE